MEKTVKDEKNPMREAVRGLEARELRPPLKPYRHMWRPLGEKADEAKVVSLLEKGGIELSAENIAIGVELVEKRYQISSDAIENARELKRLGIDVDSETMGKICALKRNGFDVSAKTIMAKNSAFTNAKEALAKTIFFYPKLMEITKEHNPEARKRSLERLEGIADMAPAKAYAMLEGMKGQPFFKNDVARFLATDEGKEFEAYLKEKLEAKKKEEGGEQKPQTG